MKWTKEFLRKWYVILICAVLCAGGLYIEKEKIHPGVPASGDMIYIRVVQFEEVPLLAGQEIVVDKGLYAWPNLTKLKDQLESSFNMNKLDSGWEVMKTSKKFSWEGGHFRANKISLGTYELIVSFSKMDGKDEAYIQENADKLLDIYESYFQKVASTNIPNVELRTIDHYNLIENDFTPSREGIGKKYAIIGFVLVALVGVVIVMVWDARKRITLK